MRCPRFKLRVTCDNSQRPGTGSMRPDLCLYDDTISDSILMAKNKKYIAHFGYAEFFIEVKTNPQKNDPFSDPALGKNTSAELFIERDDSNSKTAAFWSGPGIADPCVAPLSSDVRVCGRSVLPKAVCCSTMATNEEHLTSLSSV